MTKLGKTQMGVLLSLADYGSWPGGWIWGNRSTTIKALDSLVRRGLARKATWSSREVYQITEAGRKAVAS